MTGSGAVLLGGGGERERVHRRVPVAELVAGMEAGDPRDGGVRDGGRELDFGRAVRERGEQRLDARVRVVAEHGLDERRPCTRTAAPAGPRGKCGRKPLERGLEQRDEIA